ncbi:MAG: ABC transporter permease [Leptolyngbyaceae cyanobacterium bins.59]|nr:ABC transporter permease [Leptolyngbyaceae cyanobacterium bins.59]
MDISESINIAFRTLSANRLRSLLTVLGIIIGNASVIAMIGVGQGAQRYTTQQIQALGTNLLFVFGGSGGDARRSQQASTLTLEDAEAILSQVSSVKDVAPQVNGQQLVSYGATVTRSSVVGTVPAYIPVRNMILAEGRFFTPVEVNRYSRVAVLGSQSARQLFGDRSAVGETIRLNNMSFDVIGVLEAKGATGGSNPDEAIFLPITTTYYTLLGRSSPYGLVISFMTIAIQDEANIPIAEYQITNLLRLRHKIFSGPDDFTVRNQKDTLEAAENVTQGLTILLAAAAGISLLVGGIGIMNIMLASVTERTQEIGLRKAVGASQMDVLQQFLIESVILSVVGGIIGTVVGAGAVIVISQNTPLKSEVSPGAVILAVGVSAGIGLVFGVVPAQRAARLDPIVALRNL